MIIDDDELKALDGKEIVFTIGCFDLFHVNHLWFLSQTKKHAPECKLLIGLISDAETIKIKGAGRPIISQLERAKVLDALELVDYVFVAPDLEPQDLSMMVVETVRPKYLSSTKTKWLKQEEELHKYGTSLIFLKEQVGRSTTQIVNQIRGIK